jgi:hypothetical protein
MLLRCARHYEGHEPDDWLLVMLVFVVVAQIIMLTRILVMVEGIGVECVNFSSNSDTDVIHLACLAFMIAIFSLVFLKVNLRKYVRNARTYMFTHKVSFASMWILSTSMYDGRFALFAGGLAVYLGTPAAVQLSKKVRVITVNVHVLMIFLSYIIRSLIESSCDVNRILDGLWGSCFFYTMVTCAKSAWKIIDIIDGNQNQSTDLLEGYLVAE